MKLPEFLTRNHALRISLIYAVVACGWILFSDRGLALLTDHTNLAWLQTVKGVGFVVVTATLLYGLISSIAVRRHTFSPPGKLHTYKPLLFFIVLTLGISATGRLAFVSLRDQMLHETSDNLEAIGKLKAEQIAFWLKETTRDGELLTRNSLLANDIADWIHSGMRDRTLKARFTRRLGELADNSHYSGLILFDRTGKALINPNLPDVEIIQHRQDALRAMTQEKTVLVDFHYRDEARRRVELGIVSPLTTQSRVVGAIYFSIDPEEYFYPLVMSWPVASQSAESQLVRRDGEMATFLNQLRHKNNPPLSFHIPLKESSVPSVQAVLGRIGITQGPDYRGVPVLAYLSPIAGTEWKIVTKVDRSEALSTVRHLALVTSLVSLLLFCIATAVGWVWWRREIFRLEQVAAIEKEALAQHFDYMSKYASDIILLCDEAGHVLEANDRALEVYGYPREEFIGMSVADLRTDSHRGSTANDLAQIVEEKSLRYEVLHKTRTGREFPAEVNARLIESKGRRYIHAILRDITDRKQAENQIRRMSRFYAASAQVNETLVRHWRKPESELMNTICRIAVEHGGMKMAWIGQLDASTRKIAPVASFGDGREYLEGIVISIDDSLPQGRGPTGTALREGTAVTIDDYVNDPRTSPWHERGIHYGWGSSAAFPILRDDSPYAVLTVYHGDANAFDAQIITLMMEMVGNIGFALDIHDTEQRRNELQTQLAHVLEISPACIYTLKPDPYLAGGFHISFLSANIEQVTGYPVPEWFAQPGFWANHLHPEDRAAALDVQNILLREGRAAHHYRFLHADGGYRWINDQMILVRDAAGNPQEIIGAWTDSSELMLAQQFVQESEHRLTLLLGNLPGMAFRCANDEDWSMQFVSQGCEALTGYQPESLLYNFRTSYNDLIVPEDRQMVWDQIQEAIKAGRHYQINYRIRTAQGELKHVWEQGVGIRDARGQIEAIEGLVMDVTARHLAETALKTREEQLRSLGDNLPDGYVYQYEVGTDGAYKFHYLSAGVEKIHGYTPTQIITDPGLIFRQLGEASREPYAMAVEEGIRTLNPAFIVLEFILSNGQRRWLQVQSRPHRQPDGGTVWDGIAIDITQQREMQARIAHLTRFDPATGLPNQAWFQQLLADAAGIAASRREQIAVVRIDIDNFVEMEDRLGLESSDAVLKIFAERLTAHNDSDGLAARLGSNSFALAYPHISDVGLATQPMQALLQAVTQPVTAGAAEFSPLVRIGISFYPTDAGQPAELLHQANIALNQGRHEKGSTLRFYTQQMNDLLETKNALIGDISRAIARGEFELYYLPQVDLASGRVVGAEALIRWNHPVRGFLPPSEFIALAEESGQIGVLGGWIVQRAIRQMKEWYDAGQTDLAVTINASALQTESGELIDLLQQLLKETGLPPTCVELELNEKALVTNASKTQQWMQKLKSVHIQLSIDDFGTGYSSLFYLKQFSVDKIKIDKSFIDELTTDHNNAVIVQATITMAHGLGLKVVAEGVETQAQANYLRTLHCDQIQGFLFSPPVKAEAILPMLRGRSAPVVAASEVKRTLLLVDDEPNVLSSLKRILRRDGYQILTANSGEEALQLLAQHPIHVIVSDQRMPMMTGIEFLSRVKVMHPGTIRIILSGYTEVNTITDAVNKGEVYKFLTKPWDDNELRATIQEAFQRYETQLPQDK